MVRVKVELHFFSFCRPSPLLPHFILQPDRYQTGYRFPDYRRETNCERVPIPFLSRIPDPGLIAFPFHPFIFLSSLALILGQRWPTQPPPRGSRTPPIHFVFSLSLTVLTIFFCFSYVPCAGTRTFALPLTLAPFTSISPPPPR